MVAMNKEYLGLYRHYSEQYGSNTCIFLMVGKFYEMYDSIDPVTGEGQTSMKRAVEALNLATTQKENGDCLAGFPEQSLHKFAAVLTRANWTVVVCDQVKDTAGSVKGRPCARILSPGTHVEVATTEAPYVAGLWLEERWSTSEPPAFGIAFFDLTTGLTSGFQGQTSGNADVWSADTLVQALQIHNPREVVVFWRGARLSQPTEQTLRNRLGGLQGLVHIRQADTQTQGAFETELVRREFLTRLYAPKTMLPVLEYLHLGTSPLTERALIGTLRFMEDHLPSSLERLQAFQPWTPKGRVHLGNNALTQLNCTSTRLEDSVLGLYQKTLTPLGRRGIRGRILTPISDTGALNERLQKVETMMTLATEKVKSLERYLRQIYDFPRIHRKILTYSVSGGDIVSLHQTYVRIQDAMQALAGTCFSPSPDELAQFTQLQTTLKELFDLKKAALNSDDLSFLQDIHAPKTAAVEADLAAAKKEVEAIAQALCIWAGLPIDALRLEFPRDGSVYFITGTKTVLQMLKKVAAQKIAEAGAHDKVVEVSLKSAKNLVQPATTECPLPQMEVTVTKTVAGSVNSPVLERIYGRVAGLRARLAAAVREELPPLCNRMAEVAAIWDTLETWVTDVDTSLCIAAVSKARGFTRPQILETTTESSVHVEGLRHPLIEDSSSRIQYVQHTVTLGGADKQTGWLVYGMNASGKSSLMKALGISILLAQTGCYVPATRMELRPFRAILTRILNHDNLWAGLSSFAVEMSELRDILVRADPYSLVLGDELCSGTESISATALVASGIQHLLAKRSRFVFATHLHSLMDLPQITEQSALGVWHLKVNYDAARDLLIYDRSLHKGAGSSLYGIEVARALHLPMEFIETAQKIRRNLLGRTVEEEAKGSDWNSQIVRRVCEVCSHPIVRDLEVHHIRQRSEAIGDRFADGQARDGAANLIVVCSKCHDKHHAGQLNIQPLQQTSMGLVRPDASVSDTATTATHSKWSDDERATIINVLKRSVNVPLKRIVFELETNHGIQISEGTLRKMREKGA